MQLSNAYLITINKQPIWRVKLRVKLSYGLSRRILNQSYDWLSIVRLVRKNTSVVQHQDSVVTVISVQDASNASPVNLSSAIIELNHVLRRRSIETSVPHGHWQSGQNLKQWNIT